MIQTPYNYFMSIYKNTHDAVICIDETLKVVYISDAFKYNYEFDINNDIMANCYMPSKYLNIIQKCICNQISDSFIFKNILSNTPKKCLIIPTQIEQVKLASIFLIDIDMTELDTVRGNELRSYILDNESEIRDITSTVIMYSRDKKNKLAEDLRVNPLIRSALILRKKFEQLVTISKAGIKSSNYYLLQVSEYLLRTEQLAKEILTDDRINFTNDFANGIIVTEFCYDYFDILMSNAISLVLQNTHGKTNIFVRNRLHNKGSFVILTKDIEKCDKLETRLNSEISDYEPTANIKNIEKIINSYQGVLVVDNDEASGFSLGFTLPPMPKRTEIFRQPAADKAKEQPELSVFASMLSEFVENN